MSQSFAHWEPQGHPIIPRLPDKCEACGAEHSCNGQYFPICHKCYTAGLVWAAKCAYAAAHPPTPEVRVQFDAPVTGKTGVSVFDVDKFRSLVESEPEQQAPALSFNAPGLDEDRESGIDSGLPWGPPGGTW